MNKADDIRILCKATGTLEMPRVAGVIEILSKLDRDVAKKKPDVLRGHADQIYGSWLSLEYRGDGVHYSFKDEVVDRKDLRDEKCEAKADGLSSPNRGVANALRAMLVVARGKSDLRWRKRWADSTGNVRDLVWRATAPPLTLVDGKRARAEFDTSGLDMICASGRSVSTKRTTSGTSRLERPLQMSMLFPKRTEAVPLLEAALCKIEAIPAAQRRIRESGDELTKEFEDAVGAAFREITGREKWGLKSLIGEVARYLSASKT